MKKLHPLKTARLNKGITQVELAEKASKHMRRKIWPHEISRWENGHINPNAPALKALITVLGVTFEEILE